MPHVVVAVDESPEAYAALAWAIRYAEVERAHLDVVTIVPPLLLSALWTDVPADNDADAHLEAARQGAEQMLSRHELETEAPISVDVDVDARLGHPVTELVKCSAGADLLVVGSRRPGALGRAVGSVSDAVAHHARCPIVVVRSDSGVQSL